MSTSFDRSEIEPFRCEVEPRRDAVYVHPIGELDLSTVPVVEETLTELASVGFVRLVLDLRGLQFLDSAGLRLIIEWDAKAREGGLTFDLIRGPATVQRLLELTGTDDRVSFVEPRRPARAAPDSPAVA
jgi:anti-sigma B factor antagonist